MPAINSTNMIGIAQRILYHFLLKRISGMMPFCGGVHSFRRSWSLPGAIFVSRGSQIGGMSGLLTAVLAFCSVLLIRHPCLQIKIVWLVLNESYMFSLIGTYGGHHPTSAFRRALEWYKKGVKEMRKILSRKSLH